MKEIYKIAHDRQLVRYLRDDHVLYSHRHVSTRVQMNQLNLDEIENAKLRQDNCSDVRTIIGVQWEGMVTRGG